MVSRVGTAHHNLFLFRWAMPTLRRLMSGESEVENITVIPAKAGIQKMKYQLLAIVKSRPLRFARYKAVSASE